MTDEKIKAQKSSGKGIIKLSDDSPEEQLPQSDQYVKLMEDQLAGAKQFVANLFRGKS